MPESKEVSSASDWADFVSTYPSESHGLVSRDWLAASHDHDVVHMAVAAAQGLLLRHEGATIAAMYWDVESTFWLRWCFNRARLVATNSDD